MRQKIALTEARARWSRHAGDGFVGLTHLYAANRSLEATAAGFVRRSRRKRKSTAPVEAQIRQSLETPIRRHPTALTILAYPVIAAGKKKAGDCPPALLNSYRERFGHEWRP